MRFSIITACCNDIRFLPDAIKSVRKQKESHEDLEWIIVDDVSSDGSYKFLKTLEEEWIHLIRNEKKHFCSGTYLRALRNATGDICGVLDADDSLADGAVSRIVRVYEENKDLGHIYTQNYWCKPDLSVRRMGLSSLPKRKLSFVEMSLKRKQHCYSHWRTFRRDIGEPKKIFPKGLVCAVDKNMGFAVEEMSPGGFLPEPLYYYRYYKGNMSTKSGGNQRATWMKLARLRQLGRKSKKIKVFPIRQVS